MRTDLARQNLELSPRWFPDTISEFWLGGYPSANPENCGPQDTRDRF